jgi:hypothetical protein
VIEANGPKINSSRSTYSQENSEKLLIISLGSVFEVAGKEIGGSNKHGDLVNYVRGRARLWTNLVASQKVMLTA